MSEPLTDLPADPGAPREPGPEWMDRALLLPLLVVGLALGVIGSFLVPLRVGGTLVPLAPVLAVVGNVAVGVLGARAVGSRAGAVVPAAGWLLVVLALGSARPEGDVVLPGGGGEGMVALAFILLGAVAAAVGVGLGPATGATPSGASGR